ncbi:MAG: dinitrogenase iron-molybdenum cofactor biosynthesis protein [Betaproteobacteria bacterium HGW-Betaproteobacteria-7]|jgi:nitrogen fixation protein NifX|nr:MAG: dinitrogenase iron-molybdenum cofactor biosynthesis protein [Betaproteobacteria bacterium HGW-Betaproteobacteria-7]
MSAPPIASREAALRIALAARTLDGLDVRALVGALADKYDLPLTESKLASITVEDLRVILAGGHAEENCVVGVSPEALKDAVRFLWGENVHNSELPVIDSYADGDLPGSIRVAIANNKGENLDGHFGSCERFLIYQLSPSAMKLIAIRSALDADTAEDKNKARAEVIADCDLVFIQSIGGPAAAKVVRAGIHPLKKPKGGAASEILGELQAALTSPPPWLARIMGVQSSSLSRFAEALDSEDA